MSGFFSTHSDEELRFMYENGQGHLTLFCIAFVWLRGRPSPVRIMTQDQWFMYQNQLGPSGGIYYPNFVPCFIVVQLNTQIIFVKTSSVCSPWLSAFCTSQFRFKGFCVNKSFCHHHQSRWQSSANKVINWSFLNSIFYFSWC